jgi:hypothetical protein
MQEATRIPEVFNQFATKSIEAMGVWAETNQRVMRELVELGAVGAKEWARLYADLSRAGLEALKEGQSWWLRWQAGWREATTDPAGWYQRFMQDSVSGTQQVFRLAEESAQAVSRAAERMQATTEQAGKGIQETFAGAVSRMKEIYAGA